jgi:hypothetical protein
MIWVHSPTGHRCRRTSAERHVGADHQGRVIAELTSEALRTSSLWRPASLIELRKTDVVQSRGAKSRSAELTGDRIAAVVELAGDSLLTVGPIVVHAPLALLAPWHVPPWSCAGPIPELGRGRPGHDNVRPALEQSSLARQALNKDSVISRDRDQSW